MTVKLTAEGLTLIRGENCLFQDLGFALSAGEVLVLEGPNGSGKTSLLRAIAGLASLEAGEVRWNGTPIRAQRQAFHGALAWLSHRSGLKGDLSLLDNLRFEAALRPQRAVDFDEVCARLSLMRLKKLPLRVLSAGQQRRVALARLLLADVPLWMMDEPFTNLDREGRDLVLGLVDEHVAKGGVCVIAAHQDITVNATVRRVQL